MSNYDDDEDYGGKEIYDDDNGYEIEVIIFKYLDI